MAEIAQTFSIDPYAAERSKIARQQKFAELLQSQALQPNEKFSYAGIEAPISAAGGLAKALQAGMSGYLQGDAARKEDVANTKQETDYNSANEAFIRGMTSTPGVPEVPGYVPATQADLDSRATSIAQGSTDSPLMLGESVPVLGGRGAPGTEGTPGTAAIPGSYDRVMKELSRLQKNPYATQMNLRMMMSKAEKDMAQTKLGPDEKVYDARGNLLFGNEPRSQSALGKLADDYKNGRITKAEYDAGVSKETNLSPTAVINNVGPNAYVTDMGQGLAKADLARMDAAQSAPERIATSNRIRSIIDSGEAITGAGADIRLKIASGLNVVGGGDEEKIVATQSLVSDLARVTMQSIKSSGLGAGQGFTDSDRTFLEKAAAGNIDYQPATIRRLADLNDKAARLDIKQGNAARARALKQPGLEHLLGDDVAMPGEYAPPPSNQWTITPVVNR